MMKGKHCVIQQFKHWEILVMRVLFKPWFPFGQKGA